MQKATSLLFFITAIFLGFQSCQKDDITNELKNFVKVEDYYEDEYDKSVVTFDEEAILEISARADEEFYRFKALESHLKSGIPHWVGVIARNRSCPSGIGEIRYFMDCEDNRPATRYVYGDNNCFKAGGLEVTGGNLYWVVCIVDASIHNFDNINKSYAIFDFSHIQFLRGAGEVFVYSDDEDTNNKNRYDSPSYGFAKNPSSPYYPVQHGDIRNTPFWFYFFKAENTSHKLPNIGFEYAVFSKFDCCNWQNQNIVLADTEDKNNKNIMKVYLENSTPFTTTVLDDTYRIFEVTGNINYFIQNSAVYRY